MDKPSIKHKKVLYLITKSNWGGAQRYVYDLATGLPKDEFEAVVALGGDGPLATKLQEAGIRVIFIPSLQRDISLAKEARSFFELWRIIRAEKPEVLHINSSKAGALGTLIGRLARVPQIVFTAHGWAFNEDRPKLQKLILKKIHWMTVLLSHTTIAVSREVKRQMNWPFAERKMEVIHNGRAIDHLKSREAARTELITHEPGLRPYQNDFWSLTIAELHPVKRHQATIGVIKKIVDEGEVIRHLIIGGGEEEQKLRSLVSKLDLEDNVFLLGAIPEAADFLAAADTFILPSLSEAMPYAIIEALIAEVPTIATAVGGIPEVIENGISGLLAPPLDDEALHAALKRLMNDIDLRARLQAGARERQRDFTPEKMLEKTLDLYRA